MGTVLITGAASGMGATTVVRLRAAGHRTIGVDRANSDIVADLSTADGRQAAVNDARKHVDHFDGVVACAGLGLPGPDPSAIVSVNFFGVRDILEGVRPVLRSEPTAKAVIVVSNSSVIIPDLPADLVDALLASDEALAQDLATKYGDVASYACSKFAIARWMRRVSVSDAWAGAGIRLNGVAPGATRTPMLDASDKDPGMKEMAKLMPVPAGREGRADEIASLIEVLLSPVAELLIGQLIFHDGGTETLLRGEHWPSDWSMSGDAN